jgi:methyl-accepting chemotaxis protein
MDATRFFCYAPIQGTPWSLVITVPRSDFMAAPQRAVLIGLLVTLALLFLFTGVFNHYIKKILTNPLRVLTVNAHRLALGQFAHTLAGTLTKRGDEIGLLGDAYVNMSESIRDMINDIDQITRSAREGYLDRRARRLTHQGD